MSKREQSDSKERTPEGKFLARRPDVRHLVSEDAKFHEWRDSIKKVVVDDEKFYIRGGDQLVDDDQLVFEWAFNAGVISPEEVSRLDEGESEEGQGEDPVK